MRRIGLTALAVAASAVLLVAPAHGAASGCDAAGDRRAADDCIAHALVGAAKDGRVEAGEIISVRPRLHEVLRGAPATITVQARRVRPKGAKGPWLDVRRVRWPANAAVTRRIAVCTAALAGRYQLRLVTALPAARQGGSATTATSAPTGVVLPRGAANAGCPWSPADQTNIEVFNMNTFGDNYLLSMQGGAESITIGLSCSDVPPTLGATLAVGVFPAGQSTGAGCGTAPLAFDAATLEAGGYPWCTATPLGRYECHFEVYAWNGETGMIYSETIVEILLPVAGTSATLIPELEPATLPLCPSTINPCLLDATCALSTKSEGQLQLCDSATSCSQPSAPSGSGATAYFDTSYFARPKPQSTG